LYPLTRYRPVNSAYSIERLEKFSPQLADVIALARAVPQATIVMCHVGGVLGYGAYAGKKDEVHAAWRANMAELATCPNVSVKPAAC
jgi:L-fuconolactonase